MSGGTLVIAAVLHRAVTIMTPFLMAATGGLFTELTGMLNIALEGLMLIGAFFCVVFAAETGSLILGILLGSVSSMALAFLFGAVSLRLKANIFITGLATNLLASGLTIVLAFDLYGTKGVVRFPGAPRLPLVRLPLLERIPLIGDILSGHNILVYVSWLMLALAAVVLYRTPYGLRLRATGHNPETVRALGLRPAAYQLQAIVLSGFACGLAGGLLTLGLSAFVPGITAGRGWIALVVIYLGRKKPAGILIASAVFGLAEAYAIHAQGTVQVPADIVLAFPYLATTVAMTLFSIAERRGRQKHRERHRSHTGS